MIQRLGRAAVSFAALSTALALAACGGGSSVPPTSQTIQPQSLQQSQTQAETTDQQGRPMFVVLPYKGAINASSVPGGLPTWTGSFKYSGTTYHYTMVGANPATSNVATTVPVDIIPIKVTVAGTTTFDPSHTLTNGRTVVQNTVDSPMFQSGVDFKAGSVDLGNTQYIDAYQRGNFWSKVKKNTGYHLVLGTPTVLAEQSIKTPNRTDGSVSTQFGVKVGLVDINYFDAQAQSLIASLAIPAGTLPIFVTYDVYLTNGAATGGNCCIGGYHSYTGTNTYSHFTYIDKAGAFSQDVSALSHEIGEWADDPLTNNTVSCGILENGDPLEGTANYGDYSYTLNGFAYNLQDLVFLRYFGAPATTSVNSWSSLHHATLSVCQNGG